MAEAKKRRLREADWDKVETFVNDTYEARKNSKRRQDHELKWKEVDRQIEMKPMQRILESGQEAKRDWQSAIELGELSTASEIIADDVMRIIFPNDRMFFRPHVELRWPLGQDGRPQMDDDKQDMADGLLRNLMSQQHTDFGFRQRFRLSVKEGLHHGSFASEIRFQEDLMVKEGYRVRTVGAPVWVPYSMWNTYPDPSPSVVGTNMFYTGAMILVEFMPLYKLKNIAKGEGYIPERVKLIEKRSNKNMDDDTEDVEIIKFKGDISIDRSDGDIYLPNSEVKLANGKLIYYAPAELPYPNVIFSGYERQDVRDPYYTSPIIKMSPTHKMTTIVANEFIDGTKLKVKPPIEYDSNDPDYAQNDGPRLAPGAKTGTRSMGQGFKALDIGDPSFALHAYSMGTQQMKEGLGVSANRAGVRDVDRETATAANLANQGAEVRTMGFIQQLEPQALLPFVYMQHELNRSKMKEYTFYSDEMHTPDFVRATNKDIQANAHFEIVGSRGVLGEEQRQKRVMGVTAFFSGNPLFAGKLKSKDIMLEAYRDAGKKNPEEFVMAEDNKPQIPPQLIEQMKQMQQVLQQMSEENKALKSKHEEAMAKLQLDAKKHDENLAMENKKHQDQMRLDRAELTAQMDQQRKDFMLALANFQADVAANKQNVYLDMAGKAIDFHKIIREHDKADVLIGDMQSMRGDMQTIADGLMDRISRVEGEVKGKKGPKRRVVTVRGKRIPVVVDDE